MLTKDLRLATLDERHIEAAALPAAACFEDCEVL